MTYLWLEISLTSLSFFLGKMSSVVFFMSLHRVAESLNRLSHHAGDGANNESRDASIGIKMVQIEHSYFIFSIFSKLLDSPVVNIAIGDDIITKDFFVLFEILFIPFAWSDHFKAISVPVMNVADQIIA